MEHRTYDLIFICRPDAPEEEIDKVVSNLEQAATERGGKIEKVEKWGLRRMAYRVMKYREGQYVLMQLRGIQGMIESDADCEQITQQLSAARRALDKAFYNVLACAIQAAPDKGTAAKAGVEPELVYQAIRGGLAGSTVMDAARELGIYIPHFCYHKKLSIAANCRMCLVDIEKSPKPMPACATPVAEGMKVRTHSPVAKKATTMPVIRPCRAGGNHLMEGGVVAE